MEVTPAWFPISSQRIGGEPELQRGVYATPLFWIINKLNGIKKSFNLMTCKL